MSDMWGILSQQAVIPQELTLTAMGLKNVKWESSDESFEFVFSNHHICSVHSVLAEFISPKVSRIRAGNSTCFCYEFTEQCSALFQTFNAFISTLLEGRPLQVTQENIIPLLKLAHELDNEELFSLLIGMINLENLRVEDALALLETGTDLRAVFTTAFGNLTDFIASRFYALPQYCLDNLGLETLQLLLSSPALMIETEDSLYQYLRQRAEDDIRFMTMFEFLRFEYMSVHFLRDFASFVSDNFNFLSRGIWERVWQRLFLDVKPETGNPRAIGIRPSDSLFAVARCDNSDPLNGIIAYLTQKFRGNVDDTEIVTATLSTTYTGGDFAAKYAADLGSDSMCHSENRRESWFCYDFKERRVQPTSYSVRSCCNDAGGHHLKSWVVEVSNDGQEWIEIDRHENNNDLNGRHVVRNFNLANPQTGSFRFFRLKQIGPSHNQIVGVSDCLVITSLEVFGFLWEQ